MRQDFQRTSGQGHQNFPSRHHQKEKCWDLLTPPRRCQVFQVRSQMLRSSLSIATECWILERRLARGFVPNPSVIERERSHSSEERHACLLVGTWYYLIPDPSGALVSEVVDRKDLALERTHIPGHHFTPTGPTDGHNNEFDCATDDNVFLARSSDEVYPKHLSPDERVAFKIADAAEWKAIVDSGLGESSGLRNCQHDKEGATRQGDQQSDGEATQASGGHLPETESQVQMVCFGTPGS